MVWFSGFKPNTILEVNVPPQQQGQSLTMLQSGIVALDLKQSVIPYTK